jgi:hypothetical protein
LQYEISNSIDGSALKALTIEITEQTKRGSEGENCLAMEAGPTGRTEEEAKVRRRSRQGRRGLSDEQAATRLGY